MAAAAQLELDASILPTGPSGWAKSSVPPRNSPTSKPSNRAVSNVLSALASNGEQQAAPTLYRRREHAPSSAVRLLGLPRRRSTLPRNAYSLISKNPRIHCDFRGSTRTTGREKTNVEMLPKRS